MAVRMTETEQQARRTRRAVAQHSAYRLIWSELRVREHSGRAYTVPICYVEKADGTRHQVTFRPQGAPSCTCPDYRHRCAGTTATCKHIAMAERDRDGQAPTPAEAAQAQVALKAPAPFDPATEAAHQAALDAADPLDRPRRSHSAPIQPCGLCGKPLTVAEAMHTIRTRTGKPTGFVCREPGPCLERVRQRGQERAESESEKRSRLLAEAAQLWD